MESKDDIAHEVEELISKEDIKSRKKMSQDENSDLKKKLKQKDICKVKCKNEDIRSWIKTSQDKDSDSMEELKNKDTYEIKCKDKNIGNGMKTLQDEDCDSSEESENEATCEIKSKDEDSQNEIETSEDEDSDLKRKRNKVKFKDKDIWKEIRKMLQEKDSDAKKLLKYKKNDTCKVESEDEGIEEEYCSEATYLANKMKSAERLCQKESTQLYNLKVQLRHKIPPQHDIETRAGSHMPTRKQIEEFEKIIPLKKGSYSFEEDKIIASNWKAFCKLHNWDIEKVTPFLQLRVGTLTYMRNTERRKFVQFLADGLPNRTLYSVYHRFRNLYENNLQRRYKPEEDEMIINHLEHNPSLDEKRKYADLAKVLRRTRHSIWRRYRILKRRNENCKNC